MSGLSYRLPSDVETDCAEDIFESRVPCLGLQPHMDDYHRGGPVELRSRDVDWGLGCTEAERVDSVCDSGFSSVPINNTSLCNQRDSGFDIASEINELHISERLQMGNARDSGLGEEGFLGAAGVVGSTPCSDTIQESCDPDLAYESVHKDEPLPSFLQQLFEQDDDGDR